MTPVYSSKSRASRAARAALGDNARFTTDKTPAGWTWSPMNAAAEDARRSLVGRQRASREGFPKAGKVHVTPSREA